MASQPLRRVAQACGSHRSTRADRTLTSLTPRRLSGSSQLAPPPYTRSRVHSRKSECPRFGRSAPPGPGHVPPSWSLTTPTVCSTSALAGLLHPAAGHEVQGLSGISLWSKLQQTRPSGPCANPTKSLPPAAAPRHRGRCPLAVTPAPHTDSELSACGALDEPGCSSPKAATSPVHCGAHRRSPRGRPDPSSATSAPTEVDAPTRSTR